MLSTRSTLLISLLLFLSSCSQPFPEALIFLEGSKGLKHFYTGGIYRVLYQIDEKFPAEEAVRKVSQRLESKGWQPLKYEFLHPDIPTSVVTGWTFYEDPPKKPEWVIYEWSGNWIDKSNNVVTYAFQYKDPIEKYKQKTVIMRPSSNTMFVHAVYMPQKVAVNMRESINRKKTKK
jgi:hypothetical protein